MGQRQVPVPEKPLGEWRGWCRQSSSQPALKWKGFKGAMRGGANSISVYTAEGHCHLSSAFSLYKVRSSAWGRDLRGEKCHSQSGCPKWDGMGPCAPAADKPLILIQAYTCAHTHPSSPVHPHCAEASGCGRHTWSVMGAARKPQSMNMEMSGTGFPAGEMELTCLSGLLWEWRETGPVRALCEPQSTMCSRCQRPSGACKTPLEKDSLKIRFPKKTHTRLQAKPSGRSTKVLILKGGSVVQQPWHHPRACFKCRTPMPA